MSLDALLIALQGAGFPFSPIALAVQGFIEASLEPTPQFIWDFGGGGGGGGASTVYSIGVPKKPKPVSRDYDSLPQERDDEEILAVLMTALLNGVLQ